MHLNIVKYLVSELSRVSGHSTKVFLWCKLLENISRKLARSRMHNVSACLHKSSLCSAFKRRSSDNLTSAIVADTIATDQPTCCTHCVVTVKQPYSTIICDKTLLEKINNSIWLTISKFFFNIYYIIYYILLIKIFFTYCTL